MQLKSSGSRTVTLERMWVSVWDVAFFTFLQLLRILSHASQRWMGTRPAPGSGLLSSNNCVSRAILGRTAWVGAHPCAPRSSEGASGISGTDRCSSAWIIQPWRTADLSPCGYKTCRYFSLPGNSMRNIKPSFLRLVQVIFLEEGKKILCLPRKLVTMNSKFERFSNVFFCSSHIPCLWIVSVPQFSHQEINARLQSHRSACANAFPRLWV